MPPRPTRSRGRRVFTVLAAGSALALLGILWLTAAGNLAASGTRIAELERERGLLAERRAKALVDHALATNPASMERRAAAVGFGPPDRVEFMAVQDQGLPVAAIEESDALSVPSHSPLGVLLARPNGPTPTQPDAEGVVARALAAISRPAHAGSPGDSGATLEGSSP